MYEMSMELLWKYLVNIWFSVGGYWARQGNSALNIGMIHLSLGRQVAVNIVQGKISTYTLFFFWKGTNVLTAGMWSNFVTGLLGAE